MLHVQLSVFIAACLLSAACSRPPDSFEQSQSDSTAFFVDMRNVPYDLSGLAPGPHEITFDAYVNSALKFEWSDSLRTGLQQQIAITQLPAGKVDFKVTSVPVPGRPDVEHVTVTINLASAGTYEIQLPHPCGDWQLRGFNDANGLGNTLLSDAPVDARRPKPLTCLSRAFRTVGACPHVAYSTLEQAKSDTQSHVWRVLWSEPAIPKGLGAAKFVLSDGGEEKVIVPASQVLDEYQLDITLPANGGAYNAGWLFQPEDGVAAEFVHSASCKVAAGNVAIASTDTWGKADGNVSYVNQSFVQLATQPDKPKWDAGEQ